MLEFREIQLTDKAWADKMHAESDFRGCEYSFGNNFIWKNHYDMQVCDIKDFYLIKNVNGFMYPAGNGDIRMLIPELKKYCTAQDKPLVFSSIGKQPLALVQELYGDSIEVTEQRDMFDYVYDYEALATLKGKKLHSKRNHLNRFMDNDWSYEKITEENIDECVEMSTVWCKANDCDKDDDKMAEMCAVNVGFGNYFELGFKGGLLRVDGKIQAFTFGEHLNSDTFVVHVEKALTDYQGTYPAINHQFVNHECGGYKYINREEDTGAENLRKAKLSYYPAFMEEKFTVKFKD